MDATLSAAFLLGLLSTLHCIGMCGGIIGALSFGLPETVRNNPWKMLPYISAYNLGRLSTYTLAGLVGGAFGQQLFAWISPQYGHLILLSIATTLLIAIGLYLAGWLPKMAVIEHIGRPLWRRLEPIGRRLMPVKSPVHAYLYGLVWGWLPCGLVYSALAWSTTSGSATHGALFMLAFGAGTLPAVMSAGIFTTWMVRMTRHRLARPIIGITIIVLALVSFWLSMDMSGHEHHHHH